MNAKKIAATLTALKLDGWHLTLSRQERCTLHTTTNEAIETSIDALREEAHITIYKKFGKQIGNASFVLFTDDPERVKTEVAEALLICATAKKKAWPLPKQQRYARVKTTDPKIEAIFKKGTQEAYLEKMAQQLLALIGKERGVISNHIELHLTLHKHTILNSAGVSVSEKSSDLFVEAILMAKQGKAENEFHQALNYAFLEDFNAKEFISGTATQARDVLNATKFTKIQEQGIILSGVALRDFWAPDLTLNSIAMHSSAMAKYRKLSRQNPKERVTATPVTIISNPLLDGNPASRKCDDEGVASKRTVLVEKGKWKSLHGNQRYTQYLGVPATGHLGAIEVVGATEPGLIEDGTLEIVGFSSFVPNALSGDFSAEIRLGYLYKNGKRIPIRGAMFTGNLFAMLDTMRMDGELHLARYKGPAVVRFDAGCHVAGF
jgi:predicted Zn-dependent protease